MKIAKYGKKRTQINLTALIDVLFLLIIFFSVSTQFTDQQAIGIDLPETRTSSTVSTSKKLIVIMREENELFINGNLLKWIDIGEEIKKGKYDRTQKVILNIDKKIPHGKVVRLLDLLKLYHFKKVVFGTYGNP
ncbi:MAG: biopolymer transporter ExbD [Proteobacteria bacterium]|nr:biopolymer transporter ExbD [Pseudomonadota bacterium]